MRCTFVLHRWHCAVSSTLIFSCEFSTSRYLSRKRSHLAKGTSIFCNCSGQFLRRCFPNIYSCCSLGFLHVLLGHQLPWMCITRGAEHCFSQTCSWIMCSPWCFEGDVLRGSRATFCSWVWTWNESIAIHCRRQGRKSLLVLYFLMLFCSFAEFRVAILSNWKISGGFCVVKIAF